MEAFYRAGKFSSDATQNNPRGDAVLFTTLENIWDVLRDNPVMDKVRDNRALRRLFNWGRASSLWPFLGWLPHRWEVYPSFRVIPSDRNS